MNQQFNHFVHASDAVTEMANLIAASQAGNALLQTIPRDNTVAQAIKGLTRSLNALSPNDRPVNSATLSSVLLSLANW